MNTQDKYNSWFLSQCENYLKDVDYLLINETWDDIKSIVAEIRNPFQPGRSIRLSDYYLELTLYFGEFHCHYASTADDDPVEGFKDAVEMIKRIMNDELIFQENYNKKGQLTEVSYHTDISLVHPSAKEKIFIYNWSGKINRVL